MYLKKRRGRHAARRRRNWVTARFSGSAIRFARICEFAMDTALAFISFGAHSGSVYGGADMPLIGPVPEGGTFFCPHCGALYSVTLSRLPKRDSNIAQCVVCGQTMDERDSTTVPVYKLIHRPEDA